MLSNLEFPWCVFVAYLIYRISEKRQAREKAINTSGERKKTLMGKSTPLS